jgi:hypothetical protein
MVEETIQKVLKFLDIKAEVIEKEFKQYKKIPADHNGIYIITEGDQVIYVGKGQVRSRQGKHWDKAFANKTAVDTKGWRWLRENYNVSEDKILSWELRYILLNKETARSAVEGTLIHFLQPLANDETFKDNNRTLKEAL